MKVFIAILFLGLCFGGNKAQKEESISDLLKDNSKGLQAANVLLDRIAKVGEEAQAGLADQKEALKALAIVDGLLAKLTIALEASSQNLVATLLNISKQGEEYGHRTDAQLLELARLQEATKQLLNVLEAKLDAYQKHVLQSSRSIDRSIDGLAKLITRTVLPQINGLKCSFDSLETSQINVEVELKNLAGVKELSEDSNRKLNVLEQQLKQLNRTQELRLDTLIGAVQHSQPLNPWKLEAALRELIISQKRIELDLDQCSRQSPHQQYGHHDEPHGHGPSYGVEAQEPHQTQAPEPKHNHQSSSAVSWRESLPWETASPYQSATVPYHQHWKPAPAYGPTSKPKPKPYPRGGHSAPPSHGPSPPAHQSPIPVPPVEFHPEPSHQQSQHKFEQKPQPNHQQSHNPQPFHEQSFKPQSYQEQSYKQPEPIQQGESYGIWYGDGSLPQGY
ncbi:hypothetical protein M5D96_004136 [Drosophila gunungcola]|uniref:Uncharacterized protein n=2 Tax=Drosophila gunungcola TaxID=103775 RepID=A0A9P9YTF9_9MUSC|nr:hypothetical protein M5D96_004136 [Drosophila gunungcola]